MEPCERIFEREKETKRTYRYLEKEVPNQPIAVGAIYLQKWVVGKNPPQRIKVKITSSE